MAEAKAVDDLTEDELDAELGINQDNSDIDKMTEEQLDAELSASESQEEPVQEEKQGFGEKIARKVLPKDFTEFVDEFKGTEGGKALAGVEDVKRLTAQIGQSVMLGKGTAAMLSRIKNLNSVPVFQGLVSSEATKTAAKAARSTNVKRAIQRLAIEGAVSAQPFDYEDVKDRIYATALFATISPTLVGGVKNTVGGIKNAQRMIRSFKGKLKGGLKPTQSGGLRDPRLPSMTKVKEELSLISKEEAKLSAKSSEISASSRRQIQEAQSSGNKSMAEVTKNSEAGIKKVQEGVKAEEASIRESHRIAEKKINQRLNNQEKAFNKESDIAARGFQEKVNKFNGENGAIYGKELDVVSNEIAKSGRGTLAEGDAILSNTLKSLGEDPQMVASPLYQEILALRTAKYGPQQVAYLKGQASPTLVPRDQSTSIPFKEILNDLRSIWKKAYKGSRMTPDGVPGAVLQSNFGEYVSTLPGGAGFKSLQKAYRPVISYMNKLNSVLQPYKGEAYTKQAESLVRQVAGDKTGVFEADKALINFIEKGTERFAKGVGSVTARARQMADNMKMLEGQLGKQGLIAEQKIIAKAEASMRKISKMDETAKATRGLIEKETERSTSIIMQEAAEQEAKLWEQSRKLSARKASLGGRKDVIRTLTEKRRLLKSLGVGLTTLGGGIFSAYVVARGGRELIQLVAEGK